MAMYYPMDDIHLNIARGLVKGTHAEHKFGAVPAMSVNTTGTVWDINDTLYPWSAFSSASVLNIPAVNPSDNGSEVTVYGLDANYELQEETFTVSSSSGVTGTKPFIRVYRAYYTDTSTNVGNINVRVGSTTVLRITAGKAQTLMAIYTVPAGYTAYLTQGTASIEYGGDATIDMFVRYFGQTSFRIGHTGEVAGTGMPYHYNFTTPIAIPEKSDIDVRANVRSNNSRVTAAFDMVLIKENLGS